MTGTGSFASPPGRRRPAERAFRPPDQPAAPSGRGAIEQPNVTGDGEAELTPKFWLMVGLTG
jgi:CIC family chloride channel protein